MALTWPFSQFSFFFFLFFLGGCWVWRLWAWFARVLFVWVCLRGCVVFKVLPMGWWEWTCFSLLCSITSTWSLLVVPCSLVSCKSSFHFCLRFDLLDFQTCLLSFCLFRCLKSWVFLWFLAILIYSFIYPYFFFVLWVLIFCSFVLMQLVLWTGCFTFLVLHYLDLRSFIS